MDKSGKGVEEVQKRVYSSIVLRMEPIVEGRWNQTKYKEELLVVLDCMIS